MAVNRDKPDRWKADISLSVDMYNLWFLKFAPEAFRKTREKTTEDVEKTLRATTNLTDVRPEILRQHPNTLNTLRMSTCPPLARDRLIGLANVPSSLVKRMEDENKLPVRLKGAALDRELTKIGEIIEKLADRDLLPWLDTGQNPTDSDVTRAATVIADRLCGATANPIIRNAQEERQLQAIAAWLDARGYTRIQAGSGTTVADMPSGSYGFHMNVPVRLEEGRDDTVNVTVDVAVMKQSAKSGDVPLLIEAKSAGDFTNVNKRRKEEAQKNQQLRATYGDNVQYVLFLCGYFDSGYLGYEAAERIDWVWEHRIYDLAEFGL